MNYRKPKRDLTKWDTIKGEMLLEAFSIAEQNSLMKLLLDDLLSDRDFNQLAARIYAMHLIFRGTPYSHIQNETGLSSKTIARVSKKMDQKDGGFDQIMRKLYPRGYRYFD